MTRDRKLRLPLTPSVSRHRLPQKQSCLQTTTPFLRIGISRLQKEAVRDLLPSTSMALIEDYGKTTLILHPLAANSSTKKDDKEIRWDTNYCWRMNAIPKEDVSSPDHCRVPQDKGWLILDTWKTLWTLLGKRDLGTDDDGSLLFGCFLFSPGLGGHGYRPRNISGRWFEATPQGEKFKWLVANFGLDSSPPLQREMVKTPLVPVLKKNSGETRHLPPSEVLCYLDDTALHPAGAWGQLHIFRVLSPFGAARLQVSPWPLLNTRKALHAFLGNRGLTWICLTIPCLTSLTPLPHTQDPSLAGSFSQLRLHRQAPKGHSP